MPTHSEMLQALYETACDAETHACSACIAGRVHTAQTPHVKRVSETKIAYIHETEPCPICKGHGVVKPGYDDPATVLAPLLSVVLISATALEKGDFDALRESLEWGLAHVMAHVKAVLADRDPSQSLDEILRMAAEGRALVTRQNDPVGALSLEEIEQLTGDA